jgi:peptidoglycan/LPS O-acetylase OafA/YrhL
MMKVVLHGRARQLDGLRAVAITLVVAYHLGVPFAWGGFLGVDTFFVLSGYLITTIIRREQIRTGRIRLGRFWIRRALRLYPALIALAIGVALISVFTNVTGDFGPAAAIAALLSYTSNIVISITGLHLGNLDVTWSLAMEEQFYIVWPSALIVLAAIGLRRRLLIAVTAAASLASLALLALFFSPAPDGQTAVVYYWPQARAGELLVGCVVAVILEHAGTRNAVRRFATPLTGVGLLGILSLVVAMPHDWPQLRWVTGGLVPAAAVLSALLIAGLSQSETTPVSRLLALRPFVWVGLLSYSIYLWHSTLFHLVLHDHGGIVWKFIALVEAVGIAAASYHFVERPFLRLKDRFEPLVK